MLSAPSAESTGAAFHCHYLYHNRFRENNGYLIQAHSHLFWQLEIAVAGSMSVRAGPREFSLGRGDMILIPPSTSHSFVYLEDSTTVLSVKFELHGYGNVRIGPTRLDASSQLASLHGLCDWLLPGIMQPDRLTTAALEHVISAMVLLFFRATAPADPPRTISEKVKALVDSYEGRPVTVSAVARELGFSISHLSAQFRSAESIPLKRFIDECRIKVAIRYLGSGDLGLKEIAQILDFPDTHCFSRFCKRMTGRGPSHFRRSVRAGTNVRSS